MKKVNLRTKKHRLRKEEYEKDFYFRCAAKGIDYNYYGEWQRQYAKLVIYVTDFLRRVDHQNRTLLDVGTACGVNLRAFRELLIFDTLIGIDLSEYMIELGRETHKFNEKELIVAPSTEIPVEDESVDLLHCSQLFEHLDITEIDDTLHEFKRVLSPDGIGFITLAAASENVSVEHIKSVDESHITAETRKWWEHQFKGMFNLDRNAIHRFKTAGFSPSQNDENFYTHYADEWSLYVISKSPLE